MQKGLSIYALEISAQPYFIDFQPAKIPHRLGPLDDHGIPMVDYHDKRGPVYNPVTIIQYGLAHHQKWLETDDPAALRIFTDCAQWLIDNQQVESDKRLGTWAYSFDLPDFRAKAPWISGMAQGQSLSVLGRAWSLTGNEACYRAAQYAARSFDFSLQAGGVCAEIAPGLIFFEEVAVLPAAHILNGFFYAVVGLYDYTLAWPDDEWVQGVLKQSITTARQVLDQFDTGYWSRYSLMEKNHLADLYYHQVHIQQLAFLGNIFNVPEFNERAEKWANYVSHPLHRSRHIVTLWSQKVLRRLPI